MEQIKRQLSEISIHLEKLSKKKSTITFSTLYFMCAVFTFGFVAKDLKGNGFVNGIAIAIWWPFILGKALREVLDRLN